MIIKTRYIFLLTVLISITGASAFFFVDNKITGTAIYEPLDVVDFLKNIAKKTLERSKDDVKEQFGEILADAVQSAVNDAVDETFENVFGGETKLIGGYEDRIGIKKIYKDRLTENIIYVEVESAKEDSKEKEKKIKCEIICEGNQSWEELQDSGG